MGLGKLATFSPRTAAMGAGLVMIAQLACRISSQSDQVMPCLDKYEIQ